jgi:hypothetical protein
MRSACKILARKHHLLLMPRCKWEYDIKMESKVIEYRVWTEFMRGSISSLKVEVICCS